MGQDIVSDGLNQIMNIRRLEKKEVRIRRYSKPLIKLLELMKKEGNIDYKIDEEKKEIVVQIIKLNECHAVKPRYPVGVADIEKYLRRFLPSRRFGNLIISTNKGLMNHRDALKENLGGSLIAYFY